MSIRIEHKIWYIKEFKDGKEFYDFNLRDIPTDMLSHIVHALTYESLARAGVLYDQTKLEREFGIKIDYFKAVEQAINAKKTLINIDFDKERERNNKIYLDHCKATGLDPKQIFIDFPISK
jgi:superfamily I DNA/RNA helicase